jgi:hypothetical protein
MCTACVLQDTTRQLASHTPEVMLMAMLAGVAMPMRNLDRTVTKGFAVTVMLSWTLSHLMHLM